MEPVSSSFPEWLVPLAFAVAGLGSLILAVLSGVRTARFIKGAGEASGEVVRLQKAKGSFFNQRFDYAPVFRFRAEDGRTYTITSKIGSSPPSFEVGDLVQVRYDRGNPENARIDTLLQMWGLTVIGVIGCAIVTAALIMGWDGFLR